jgi:glyoxylase-like metal-dependent hydrolase (beta-lactamase superfamily II)
MRIRKLVVNPYQENTYLLIGSSGDAWIIDPGFSSEGERAAFQALIQAENARPVAIYLTHAHIDHVLGVAWAASHYRIPVFYHEKEEVVYEHAGEWGALMGLSYTPGPKAERFLQSGETLYLSEVPVEVLFVPGHSPGHVAFYLPSQQWLISGDVLFRGSIGNYQLPLADYNTLQFSLTKVILALPDAVTVWPGHGEATSIGYERKTNPFLQQV